MTVLEVIQRSAEFLAKKGVDSPRLQAELLLSHLLALPRMRLYLNFERPLTDAETNRFRQMVTRRGQREPLQHITGSTSFCGYEISVSRDVLVPRPETELLAEAGWTWLAARAQASSPTPTALDFGTGSGCLAIALAAKCPAARLQALDNSPAALAMAGENARRNAVADRIEFVLSDGFAALPSSSRFDLIAGNPPYIPAAEIETLSPEVRDFDPRQALDGGKDGLRFYRALASGASGFLKPGGKLMLEFGDGQEGALKEIFEAQNWVVEAFQADYSQKPRILIVHG